MNELPTPETKQESQPAWQRPQITRIDIRRTLWGPGSDLDGDLGTYTAT
ncbi:MAG: hypothetical protein JW726_15305 [Anaerolineales bacterium]|nr:hypothetical protein [Anaerolineales bacterium]